MGGRGPRGRRRGAHRGDPRRRGVGTPGDRLAAASLADRVTDGVRDLASDAVALLRRVPDELPPPGSREPAARRRVRPVVVLGDRRPELRPRRRALSDDDVAALLEAMPGLPLPLGLVTTWPPRAPASEVAQACDAAWQRLHETGVLTPRPVAVGDVPSATDPAVLEALTLPGVADLLVTARRRVWTAPGGSRGAAGGAFR